MKQNNKSGLAESRRQKIAELLRESGEVSTSELAEKFGVSNMTVRRYLHDLEDKGLAICQYGGAVAAERVSFEFAFDERHRCNLEEKRRIGAEAAGRIEEGQTVFMDTGTTTLEVGRELARHNLACRVVTSSLVVASSLWGHNSVELVLLGGKVRKGSPDLVGPGTEIMLERLAADIAILGTDALIPGRGSLARDMNAGAIAELMAGNAHRVVMVADSSKFEADGGGVLCVQTTDMDEIITDNGVGDSRASEFAKKEVTVTRV